MKSFYMSMVGQQFDTYNNNAFLIVTRIVPMNDIFPKALRKHQHGWQASLIVTDCPIVKYIRAQ